MTLTPSTAHNRKGSHILRQSGAHYGRKTLVCQFTIPMSVLVPLLYHISEFQRPVKVSEDRSS
jgi:hypothetical protein